MYVDSGYEVPNAAVSSRTGMNSQTAHCEAASCTRAYDRNAHRKHEYSTSVVKLLARNIQLRPIYFPTPLHLEVETVKHFGLQASSALRSCVLKPWGHALFAETDSQKTTSFLSATDIGLK